MSAAKQVIEADPHKLSLEVESAYRTGAFSVRRLYVLIAAGAAVADDSMNLSECRNKLRIIKNLLKTSEGIGEEIMGDLNNFAEEWEEQADSLKTQEDLRSRKKNG